MSGSQGRAMVLSYQSIPLGACVYYFVSITNRICIKYVSSLWLMLSPWIIHTLTLPSLLASSVPCIALSHLESWCKLRRCIQTPWYDMLYHTQTSLYLPQNSHHTYLLWHFHSHSEIYCHATFHHSIIMTCFIIVILLAWSCSWHRICGKATVHNFIHVTLDSLHHPGIPPEAFI